MGKEGLIILIVEYTDVVRLFMSFLNVRIVG